MPHVSFRPVARAVPLRVGGAAAKLGANFERAIQAIDGNPQGFSLTNALATSATDTEFVYALPAPTTFDRFAVPDVLETPSPSQTFTKFVEVHGSATVRPIATNDDESGRSLNRRVEIKCG